MSTQVLFVAGTWEKYNNLAIKDPSTLYFITDRDQLWKGDQLFGTGRVATELAAGLLSPEDKKTLDKIASGELKVPSYSLEMQDVPESGAVASYKLKQVIDDQVTYVGDTINIPEDKVLKSGALNYVESDNVPYPGATKGDPYLDLVLEDASSTHIYIPVKDLVDVPGAGDGIAVVNNIVSIQIDSDNAHGLVVGPAGLALNLATPSSDGALSAADKQKLDALSATYLEQNYELVDSSDPRPIVKYNDGEIRAMFAADTNWQSQQVGSGGNPDRYYTNFKAYAPEGAVSFREYSDASDYKIPDSVQKEVFEGNSSAGTDKYGRKYTNVWLPVAKRDGGTWTYFGASSSIGQYIGWYYSVEWYDKDGKLISSDSLRINLSNESCHLDPKPYYLGKYALKSELDIISNSVQWGTIE